MSQPPEREELERRIAELEAEFRRFVHAVNNPLGIIRMAAYFLQTVPGDEGKRAEYFALINENLDRVDQLVREARRAYRAGTGAEGASGPPPDSRPAV